LQEQAFFDVLDAEIQKLQTARDADFARELEEELEKSGQDLEEKKTAYEEAKTNKEEWDAEKTRLDGLKTTADAGDDQ
jgi:hypothetical protein